MLLRFESDPDGKKLLTISEGTFWQTLTDPVEVTDSLRRAQMAILSPKIDAQHFLSDNFDLKGVTTSNPFSQNIVCVSISGPKVTNVSFVDLPGESVSSAQCVF